ncbi:hypothetical protein AMECASPLE_030974 [Ameca splendens]|uniref:Uncharacterized protein n=1 Tax=Ameca splendens TaxID=208324 RepID=A0ABV1A2C1_9TELE
MLSSTLSPRTTFLQHRSRADIYSDSMSPASPPNLVKALPEVGVEYIPGRGLRQTFRPFGGDRWTAQPLSSPECPRHRPKIRRHYYKVDHLPPA